MTEIENHAEIEAAFEPAKALVDQLSTGTLKRRAEEHLEVAEQYAHDAYEEVERSDRGLG